MNFVPCRLKVGANGVSHFAVVPSAVYKDKLHGSLRIRDQLPVIEVCSTADGAAIGKTTAVLSDSRSLQDNGGRRAVAGLELGGELTQMEETALQRDLGDAGPVRI
ncbi:hypothetical protein PJL18_00369 [Paenarthrobacter nicotinovorans]|nr:hypothetical protein [Paenarthrobacter nicotinovorans]